MVATPPLRHSATPVIALVKLGSGRLSIELATAKFTCVQNVNDIFPKRIKYSK